MPVLITHEDYNRMLIILRWVHENFKGSHPQLAASSAELVEKLETQLIRQ